MHGTYEILLPLEELSGKEVIFLIAYDQYPKPLTTSEFADLVSQCWKPIDSSRISVYLIGKPYKDYFVSVQMPEGQIGYKFSGMGRNYMKSKVIPKIKQKTTFENI